MTADRPAAIREGAGDGASEGDRPSVLDPDETWHMPAQVYLAARPDDSTGDVMLEIRDWEGQQVVLAYSSLDRFLEGCGRDQPWILIPSERLAEIGSEKAGSLLEVGTFRFGVMLDFPLPLEQRGTAGGMAQDDSRWDDGDSEDWALVYLASQPFHQGDEQARLELQPMPGDHLAIMAYSSPTTLEAGCGPHQASVRIPAGLLSEARRQSGADTICLDTPLPQRLRHGPTGRE